MPAWMLAFSLGIALAGFVPVLPAAHWLPLSVLPAVLSARWRQLRLVAGYGLGLGWALWQGQLALSDRLPRDLERVDFWMEGTVAGLPRLAERSQRFRFEVEAWCLEASLADCAFTEPPVLRRSILLSDYGGRVFVPGQRWRVKVRLRRPHGMANPGGFDYEAWLLQQGYSAVGYVRDDPGNAVLTESPQLPGFERLRFLARQALLAPHTVPNDHELEGFAERSELANSVVETEAGAGGGGEAGTGAEATAAAAFAADADAGAEAGAEAGAGAGAGAEAEQGSAEEGSAGAASRSGGLAALRYPGLILALGIADGDGITSAQWDLFDATGTVHIIVVSGLHIGLAAWLGYQLCLWGLRLSRLRPGRLPFQRLAAAAAVLAGFAYTGLAGFSLPTQRAFLMLAALMLGRLLGRETSPLAGLCLALGLVLFFDTLAPQNVGFWLSFVAVALLLGCLPRAASGQRADGESATGAAGAGSTLGGVHGRCLRLRQQLFGVLRAQWAMFAGLFPLMLLFFQQASLAAPLVNLLAIPFTSILVVPLCLLGLGLLPFAAGPAAYCLLAADYLLEIYLAFLEGSLRWLPSGLLDLPAPGPLGFILISAACLAWVLPLAWRWRLLALPGLLPLFLAGPEALPPGRFRLHVLDVGQGLAVVVETAEHLLIYDSGPWFSPDFDAGEGVLLPFLRARNRLAVDRVLLSHSHQDHAGGLPALALRFPQADYLSGEPIASMPSQGRACRQGERWHWDGVAFELLHPDREYRDSNAVSCVLRISAGAHSALLTGDIEAAAEARLLRELPDKLSADLLVAAHHGSRTSSTPAFVAAVRPSQVVYSSGYLNRFGHPHPEVQDRFRRLGSQAWHTSKSGALSFELGADGPVPPPVEWRRARPRFWSTPPPRHGE